MTSGKIEKIPIDGPTQRIKTSIVEKISLHPPPALTREFLPASSFTPPIHPQKSLIDSAIRSALVSR